MIVSRACLDGQAVMTPGGDTWS